jgi:hypothetical protein
MSENVENIIVDGWNVEVTYIPSHGKYVAEAFDSDGNKFDSVASTDRQQTINTAVSLANAGEYYRPFDYEPSKQISFDDQRDLCTDDGSVPEAPRQVIQYGEKRPHSLVSFLVALVIVGAATFLLFPFIIMFLFSF